MPSSGINVKIMKYPREIGKCANEDLVPIPELTIQVLNESPEILFFGAVIEGKDDQIGCDEEDQK